MKREICRAIALLSIMSLVAPAVAADTGGEVMLKGRFVETSESEEEESNFWEMEYWTPERVTTAAKVVVPTVLLASFIAWKLKATKKTDHKLVKVKLEPGTAGSSNGKQSPVIARINPRAKTNTPIEASQAPSNTPIVIDLTADDI